jgi:hypothetical protein
MATIFPSQPVGSIPTTVLKVFNYLKGLPDEYLVWHHLAPWQVDMPDFLVISPDQRAVVIKVSNATPDQLQSRLQMVLIGKNKENIGVHETKVLLDFQKELEQRVSGSSDAATNNRHCLRGVVLCPNLADKNIARIPEAQKHKDHHWIGREYLEGDSLELWKQLFPPETLDDVSRQHIRELFTPEVVVPCQITVRRPKERNLEAGLKDFILDYDQEMVLKSDLELPTEAEKLARDFQISLVNGVAGSGKTLLLLYRLRLLCELYPSKTFLVLTHNRALIRDMQDKFCKLHADLPTNIKWLTFYSFLSRNWPGGQWRKPLAQWEREEYIRRVWLEFFSGTNITKGMLRSEIDWIQNQIDNSCNGYLAALRRGRGFRLSQQQRERMYKAYERYKSHLRAQKRTDWGEIPHLFLEMKNKGHIILPEYDVLLVDEAQFFAPLWFEILRNLVKPQVGHIFLVADPTQGFLNRGISWKSMGMEVRGHSYHLKRSYRTTQEILTLATVFYRQRIPTDDADEEILEPEFLEMPSGVVPQLLPLSSSQDEIARVVNEVAYFLKQGIPRSHILILHANWKGMEGLIQAINRKLGWGAARDPKDIDPGDYIRVTTLNRGTGLESPIVIFVGMHQLIEEEKSLRISDEERELLIVENTRRIYMAITRAGQRLILTYVGNLPEDIKWLFK